MTRIVAAPDIGQSEVLVSYRAIESGINTSITGRMATVGVAPGYFTASITWVVKSSATFQEYEGLLAELDGTSNIFALPIYNDRENPAAVSNNYLPTKATATFADGTTFTDGSAFHNQQTVANFTANQQAGAASGRVLLQGAGTIERGTKFTAFSLHRVTRAKARGNGLWDIEFQPPLSRAHPSSRPLEFDRPWMWAQLAAPDGGQIGNSNLRFHARPSMELVEAAPSSVAQALGITL